MFLKRSKCCTACDKLSEESPRAVNDMKDSLDGVAAAIRQRELGAAPHEVNTAHSCRAVTLSEHQAFTAYLSHTRRNAEPVKQERVNDAI